MGYAVKRTLFNLTFEDPDLAGMQVQAKALSVGQMLKTTDLAKLEDKRLPPEQKIPLMASMFDLFAQALASWNLEEEDGTPIPTSLDGIRSLEPTLALSLIRSWVTATVGVSPPLPQPSPDGKPSLEASMPMVPLSASRAS